MVKFKIVEEVGLVKSIDGSLATVAIEKKSSCEGCTLNICKPDVQHMEIEALNSVQAAVGQKVKVAMKSYSYLRNSAVVYGIPALFLLLGAVAGKEIISTFFINSDPDIVSAFSGLGAAVISFLCIKLWSLKIGRRRALKPVIEEILEE
jgi:sigma-E factor negative regulatory protein RseC